MSENIEFEAITFYEEYGHLCVTVPEPLWSLVGDQQKYRVTLEPIKEPCDHPNARNLADLSDVVAAMNTKTITDAYWCPDCGALGVGSILEPLDWHWRRVGTTKPVLEPLEPELKPCSYCGNQRFLSVVSSTGGYWHWVECWNDHLDEGCGAQGPVCKTRQSAINAWNVLVSGGCGEREG